MKRTFFAEPLQGRNSPLDPLSIASELSAKSLEFRITCRWSCHVRNGKKHIYVLQVSQLGVLPFRRNDTNGRGGRAFSL
jgi:hypothetical protein